MRFWGFRPASSEAGALWPMAWAGCSGSSRRRRRNSSGQEQQQGWSVVAHAAQLRQGSLGAAIGAVRWAEGVDPRTLPFVLSLAAADTRAAHGCKCLCIYTSVPARHLSVAQLAPQTPCAVIRPVPITPAGLCLAWKRDPPRSPRARGARSPRGRATTVTRNAGQLGCMAANSALCCSPTRAFQPAAAPCVQTPYASGGLATGLATQLSAHTQNSICPPATPPMALQVPVAAMAHSQPHHHHKQPRAGAGPQPRAGAGTNWCPPRPTWAEAERHCTRTAAPSWLPSPARQKTQSTPGRLPSN